MCCWYLCISVIFLLFYVGIFGTICLFIQPCVSSSITIFRKKYIPWIVHMSFLVIIYAMKNNEITMKEVMHLDETRYYMLTIAICYIQIRSISYSHESPLIREFVSFEQFFTDLLQNAAYCLYLPTLFLGPIILYDEFLDGVRKCCLFLLVIIFNFITIYFFADQTSNAKPAGKVQDLFLKHDTICLLAVLHWTCTALFIFQRHALSSRRKTINNSKQLFSFLKWLFEY